MYQSYEHKIGYHGALPLTEQVDTIPAIGWNKNAKNVFIVSMVESTPILRISGETYGALISKSEFENFHLKLKVRWGNIKWNPRKDKLMDSGICYFAQGDPGVDYWRTWMLSQEMQIMEGHLGDYWNIAHSAIDIKAYIPEGSMCAVASEKASFISVGTGTGNTGFVMRQSDYEKPKGDWNEIELICYQGKSIHIVNGHVVMILQHSRYHTLQGDFPLTRGKLQIQSEGCEVYYKELKIKELKSLSGKYQELFL